MMIKGTGEDFFNTIPNSYWAIVVGVRHVAFFVKGAHNSCAPGLGDYTHSPADYIKKMKHPRCGLWGIFEEFHVEAIHAWSFPVVKRWKTSCEVRESWRKRSCCRGMDVIMARGAFNVVCEHVCKVITDDFQSRNADCVRVEVCTSGGHVGRVGSFEELWEVVCKKFRAGRLCMTACPAFIDMVFGASPKLVGIFMKEGAKLCVLGF
jgi:hypothetical protein